MTIASAEDKRSKEEIEKSRQVACQFRKSLYANPRYESMMKNLGLLPEIATFESELAHEVKLWKLTSLDDEGKPKCVRTFNVFNSFTSDVISTILVNEDHELLVIGCQSGSVYYIKVFIYVLAVTTHS